MTNRSPGSRPLITDEDGPSSPIATIPSIEPTKFANTTRSGSPSPEP